MIAAMTESFPRQRALTRNFTLGVPRAFQISPDGSRITFIRTKDGDDPVSCLWQADAVTGRERLIADPRQLGAGEENLPPGERARRERVRETGSGIVSYAADAAHSLAVFTLSGQVYVADLLEGGAPPRPVAALAPAMDARPDPSGRRIGYVHEGTFRVADLESGQDTVIAAGDGVTFGLAEFVAAEEMGRDRGYWWSPDGSRVLLARVDERPVNTWHIADPARPDREPRKWKYPAAGTPNALVSLFLADAATGELTPVPWDTAAFPYLAAVRWDADPLVVTQTRDQKRTRVWNALTGEVLAEEEDEYWTDIVDGAPAQLGDGRVAWTRVIQDTRRLVVAAPAALASAPPLTPPGLHIRQILGADGGTVFFTASREPTEIGVWRYGPDGLSEVAAAPGVHTARARGGTTVVISRTLDDNRVRVTVSGGAEIASLAQEPALPRPVPRFLDAGPDRIRTAVLFPSWHRPGTPLPVLMAPYGGPSAQLVLKSSAVFLQPQWFAEQGFAVVVADGRGTSGRGREWERAIAGDFATAVLQDQVTALQAAAAQFGDLDTGRVGIFGWSVGGYLSALAVLRRPDVFRAAVAGAPVTDWRLYDTHYTERYLGDPAASPEAYQRSSLTGDPARVAAADRRPLLFIHGMADDNVLVAHTLRLSSALLAAGYPHSVMPLSGVTHMTPQPAVAENLLLLQADFLRTALAGPR
jgi:dipeptidyl-peptidase-4